MIIAYKGFDPDLSCTSGGNRFQYELDKWNEEPEANCAKNGFHCAENPLDCLSYYPNWEKSVYYLVLAGGSIDEDANDSKISCTKLRLVRQLNLEEFVIHSLNYMWEHPLRKNNSAVCMNAGTAKRGFAIVRGKKPIAKGKPGDILGFVKEKHNSRQIEEIGFHIVDDKHVLSDTWYGIDGIEA